MIVEESAVDMLDTCVVLLVVGCTAVVRGVGLVEGPGLGVVVVGGVGRGVMSAGSREQRASMASRRPPMRCAIMWRCSLPGGHTDMRRNRHCSVCSYSLHKTYIALIRSEDKAADGNM